MRICYVFKNFFFFKWLEQENIHSIFIHESKDLDATIGKALLQRAWSTNQDELCCDCRRHVISSDLSTMCVLGLYIERPDSLY